MQKFYSKGRRKTSIRIKRNTKHVCGKRHTTDGKWTVYRVYHPRKYRENSIIYGRRFISNCNWYLLLLLNSQKPKIFTGPLVPCNTRASLRMYS